MHQFQVIRDFEKAIGEYTGAPFVTCVNSCTMALRLCLEWKKYQLLKKGLWQTKDYTVTIPKRTYISVPMQIKLALMYPTFTDDDWKGMYELCPFGIYDAARRFTSNMFFDTSRARLNEYVYMCVSFHYTKILGLNHGGAILHDDPKAAHFFREMRHDGRVEGLPIENNRVRYIGQHCPISVETAAQGLVKLASLPKYNQDLPNSDYPDLSTFEVFK